jgi:hypothetical protein
MSRVEKCGVNSHDSGLGPVKGASDRGNEYAGFMKCRIFVEQLSTYEV